MSLFWQVCAGTALIMVPAGFVLGFLWGYFVPGKKEQQ